MAHPPVDATPFGRTLRIQRATDLSSSATVTAEPLGVYRITTYRFIRHCEAEGPTALEDRSPRPHRPSAEGHAGDAQAICRIVRAQRRLWHGPHRLVARLGQPRSTSSVFPGRS